MRTSEARCYATAAERRRRAAALRAGILPCLIMASLGGAVQSQEITRDTEITLYAGRQWGGDFTDETTGNDLDLKESPVYGLSVNWHHGPNTQYEIYYSRQSTELDADGAVTGDPEFDLDVHYLHIGGTYVFDEPARPFLVATIGATHMDPSGGGDVDLDSETRFSLGLGAGVKFFVTRNVGFRLEGRGLFTALSSDSRVFCSGGCVIKVSSSGFVQWQANAGLVIAF